jgi:nucleotide-binding universal stress UspA family protein
MKILLAMDDSVHSQAALEVVTSMRWPIDVEIIVLSVASPMVVMHSLVDAGGLSDLRAAEEGSIQEHQELVSRVERELREHGHPTTARVVSGDAREAIVEAARLEKVDLIVVGSHGRTGFDKFVVGSVASHVVTHAPCSVLVVKRPKGPVTRYAPRRGERK